MARFVVLILVLVLAACGPSGPGSGPPSAAPTTAAPSAPSTPSGTASSLPTPRPTPTAVPTADASQSGCATDAPTLIFLADADPECFADRELTVTGWLDRLPALGFEPPGINPAWLAYPPGNVGFWSTPPVGPDNNCPEVGPPCAWMFVHVDPTSDVALGEQRRWVTVTGHFLDPAAETCHYIADGYDGPLPPDEEARAHCRQAFALTSVTAAAAPESMPPP